MDHGGLQLKNIKYKFLGLSSRERIGAGHLSTAV